MSVIPIAVICDNDFVIPTAVAITSLIKNKHEDTFYDIYIIACDFLDENQDVFLKFNSESVHINILENSSQKYIDLHKNTDGAICVASIAALLKFDLPIILSHLDKVLYLDGDIIVRKDLSDLFDNNIDDYYIGAVVDSGSIYYKHEYVQKVENYFNSGVMLLNLNKMRENNMTQMLFDTKKSLSDSNLMDQNVFNIVFDKKVRLLPIKNNFLAVNLFRSMGKFTIDQINSLYSCNYSDFYEILSDASIIHFSSKDKPWKYNNMVFSDLWYYYYLSSPVSNRPVVRGSIDNSSLYTTLARPNPALISIILPVYNTGQYLEDCMDSLLSQDIENIELICVDDCSTDNSLEILYKYFNSDSRVTILECPKNGGQSVARNFGLKVATGKYVYFMDSDDILEQGALKLLYKISEKSNLDLLLFDGKSFFESVQIEKNFHQYKNLYIRKKSYPEIYRGTELYSAMVINGDYKVSPCLQFIRKSLLNDNNVTFVEGIIHEDNVFSLQCLLLAKKVKHISNLLFRRRVRKESTMTKNINFNNYVGYLTCIINIICFSIKNQNKYSLEVRCSSLSQFCGYLSNLDKIYSSLSEDEQIQLKETRESVYDMIINETILLAKELSSRIYKEKIESEKQNVEKIQLQKKLVKLQKKLKSVKSSKTYRVGNFIMVFPRKMKEKIKNLFHHRKV